MRSLIRSILPLIILCSVIQADAQRWTPVDQTLIGVQGSRDIIPQKYIVYSTDFETTKDILWTAPKEADQSISNSSTLLTVGLPDGTLDTFRMVRYEMMESGLENDYPEMRTFRGQSIKDPSRTIRADWTESGLRAVIRDENGMIYIDHYQRNDLEHRISYYRKDLLSSREWTCDFTEESGEQQEKGNQRAGDCTFRSYRLAEAADAEYSNFFGATSSAQSGLVMSAVVTAINRVNEVYEADATIRLILIANTNLLFYYDTLTDPYSNYSGSLMLNQNQSNITSVIGSTNYDIGHVFSTGGGGVASLGCVCSSSNKAKGVTGNPSPVGDSFTIDYVAHEMGHQFGANHTFNSVASNCGGGNRSANSAFEVGSGTTIMAYAGICGVDDVQPHSDAYFHARSLLEIGNFVSTGAGSGCDVIITLNNTPPVVVATPDYNIPISTPFVLIGNVTDPNNDPLKYCWEEYDLEGTSTEPPASIDTDGPLFRSFNPTTSPARYFPRIQDIVSNSSPMWEVLPSIGRTMNFRLTVRDYHNIAGCTKEDDVTVTTSSLSGPFNVTSQNAGGTWVQGSSQTITWNVVNTNAYPVNCLFVDIKLSLDGGLTYPITLVQNEPNDGSAMIDVPGGSATTHGRIMVKASDNIFFDINNADININAGSSNFTIGPNPNLISGCNGGSIQSTISVGAYSGFSNPVTLSLIGAPAGATYNFVPAVVNPGNTSVLTISNLPALSGYIYSTVRGISGAITKDVSLSIQLSPILFSPANSELATPIKPLLDWSPLQNATSYEYQISKDLTFTTLVQSGTSATDKFQITTALNTYTVFFWRIRAQLPCGLSNWSSIYSFTTASCITQASTNIPKTISASGTPTVTSTLTMAFASTISDLNVINLVGTHTYISDLQFSLIAPNATEVLFWDRPCNDENNFNINFDDEAANSNWPCPPTNAMSYKSSSPLTTFDGLVSNGIWTLKIKDNFNGDGGSLTGWGLNVCGTPTCQLIVNQTSGTSAGSLAAALSCAANGDSIKISPALAGQSIDIGATPLTINKNVVIIAMGANTSITCSGTRVFEIPNTTTSAQINNLTLKSGSSLTGSAINNSGGLSLKNVTILKNANVIGASLVQDLPGGQLTLIGNCKVQ